MNDDQKKLSVSRRTALAKLARWPLTLFPQQPPEQPCDVEETIEQCAQGIARCWQESKGYNLTSADQLLAVYLQRLEQVAQIPSPYQRKGARLASQGYQLAGILAFHRGNLAAREVYCQRGVYWAEVAETPTLLVLALTNLGAKFRYENQPARSLQIYREALPFLCQASPLCQSSLYMKLAEAYAQLGQEREAEQSLDLAYQSFPARVEDDPAFPYADCDLPSLFLWDGMTHLALGKSQMRADATREHLKLAWQAFEPFGGHQPTRVISERNRLEILNRQAETAVYLHRQDLFTAYLMEAAVGARALGSEKRRKEAVNVYWKARAAWPRETRIRKLAELLI